MPGWPGGPSTALGMTVGTLGRKAATEGCTYAGNGQPIQRRSGEVQLQGRRQQYEQAERAGNHHPAGDLNVDDAVLRGFRFLVRFWCFDRLRNGTEFGDGF